MTLYVYVPATVSVTTIGELAPDAVAPDELVTVYEVIGSLEKPGAVNVTEIAPEPPSVAVPMVGAPGAPFAAPADDPMIGTYSILQLKSLLRRLTNPDLIVRNDKVVAPSKQS